MHASRPREIRQLIQAQFTELSASSGPVLGETLLIRDGQYCGHRYQSEELSAVWFLEEDQIKIYNGSGGVIGTIRPSEVEVVSQAIEAIESPATEPRADAA